MLTNRELVTYLLRRGLVSAETVVAGDLRLADLSRRNQNRAVLSERGPSYLAKQGNGTQGIGTLAHEAAIYRFLQEHPRSAAILPFLPRCYGYDPAAAVLLLEYVRDAQTLRELYGHRARLSPRLAATLGRALASLHAATSAAEVPRGDVESIESYPAWILSMHRPDLEFLRHTSSANVEVVRIAQGFPEFAALLDALRAGWRVEALTHNDLKWDNVLVRRSAPGPGKVELKLVDWELAGFGDPCWDVGSAFNDYLGCWLLSIPVTADAPPARFVERAAHPITAMQPAIRAFWLAYVRHRRPGAATAEQWLLRAVQYAGARLLQTAYELMQTAIQLTGNAVCLLQVSLNFLQRPREAAAHVLGLPLETALAA
jgi:hypothetical protein